MINMTCKVKVSTIILQQLQVIILLRLITIIKPLVGTF